MHVNPRPRSLPSHACMHRDAAAGAVHVMRCIPVQARRSDSSLRARCSSCFLGGDGPELDGVVPGGAVLPRAETRGGLGFGGLT
jgi:hypothetical protein